MQSYSVRVTGAITGTKQIEATNVHTAVKKALAPADVPYRQWPKIKRGDQVTIHVERTK